MSYGFSFTDNIEEQVVFRRNSSNNLVFHPPLQTRYIHGSNTKPTPGGQQKLRNYNPNTNEKTEIWWGAQYPIPLSGHFQLPLDNSQPDDPYFTKVKKVPPSATMNSLM